MEELESQFWKEKLRKNPIWHEKKIFMLDDSKSYINITLNIIKDFGIEIENSNYQEFRIKPGQKYKARKYLIEGKATNIF